jgi:hypothetical protein
MLEARTDSYIHSIRTNKKYIGKVDVLKSKEDINDLEFVLHNGFWLKQKWVEPTETFNELLKQRCKQLRETYNYIILYYSGGSDSDTMLRAFINNNIHVDEVVINRICFNEFDAPLKDIELAIQKLKGYAENIPNTRMTVNNITENILYNFSKKQNWIGTAYNGTIGNLRRFNTHLLAELDIPMLGKGNIGHVLGEMKPVIVPKSDGYYVKLYGFGFSQVSDWFYTSPDLPKLHMKQCYMVKNYFKENNISAKFIGSLGITEHNLKIRNHLAKACRYEFDSRWQPPKMLGLGLDITSDQDTEDSLVYKHIKKYAPKVFDAYTYGTIIPIVKASNKNLLGKNNDLEKIKTAEVNIGT